MATRKHQDRYANIARANVIESAAGTETFQELLTGISLGQGVGILIDQIDYHVNANQAEELLATGDSISMGWTTSDSSGSLSFAKRTCLHYVNIHQGTIIGTPASGGTLFVSPVSYQFFPALIVAAPRLFLGVLGASLANPLNIDSRLYFRYIDLTSQEYLELAETFVLVQ